MIVPHDIQRDFHMTQHDAWHAREIYGVSHSRPVYRVYCEKKEGGKKHRQLP